MTTENPLAVVKEYKLCRVKTIRVTVSMVKDCDQLIYVSVSVGLNVRLCVSPSDKSPVVKYEW